MWAAKCKKKKKPWIETRLKLFSLVDKILSSFLCTRQRNLLTNSLLLSILIIIPVQGYRRRMDSGNHTEFVLKALAETRELQILFCIVLLIFYVIIFPGNILIIVTILKDRQLGAPMFFFLANLALMDICYSCVTPPKMIINLFSGCQTISYKGCMIQVFFIHFLGASEISLLMSMAIDRYVAIFHPLHYVTVITKSVCWALVMASWVEGLIHSMIQMVIIIPLPLCGSNKLDNFFCDVTQIVRLACTNKYNLEYAMFINSGLVTTACFILLLISYGGLLIKVRTGVSQGKTKASSTCITHIIIVFIMFGPAIYLYCHPFHDFPFDKMVGFLHTVVFPLMNPMIYTLRNKEVKIAMWRLLKNCNI